MQSKAELKRQKAAAKLKPHLIKTAELLREYHSAHNFVMHENGQGEKVRGVDDWREMMAAQLTNYASLL